MAAKLTIKIAAIPFRTSNAFGGENCYSQMSNSENAKKKSTVPGLKKHGPREMVEYQQRKRQRLDRSVTQECSALLRSLMIHPAGWVFNKPVDPVALEIPDYFSIVSNPMDLGTVKSKLGKNLYDSTEEFVADIRLTFSNAMLYNPPTNNVHKMASELNEILESRWKSLKEKWNKDRLKFGSGKILSGQTTQIVEVKQNCPSTPPLHSTALPKRPNTSEENVTSSSSSGSTIKLAKPAVKFLCKSLVLNSHKVTDGGGRHACGSMSEKPLFSPVVSSCSKCGRNGFHCGLQSDSTCTSSDISSERSSRRDHRACSIDNSKDCPEKSLSVTQISKSDPDSDGAVSSLDDENMCPSSQLTAPATNAAPVEEWSYLFDAPLSPTKALRYANIKRRFADTILKAQNKALLDTGDKADPVKMWQEKERLERKQREEKARIEAQIRAAEAASRRREEIELKKQREREREAARIAMQKMEKTAEIEHNLEIQKELEMLCGCSLSFSFHSGIGGSMGIKGVIGACTGSPLEQLGLIMKDDLEDEEEELLNGEEGEILC